jgi:hypothetical protein
MCAGAELAAPGELHPIRQRLHRAITLGHALILAARTPGGAQREHLPAIQSQEVRRV